MKVDTLVDQIATYEDKPVNLYHAFRSAALDTISTYCFAESYSALTYPSFKHPLLHSIEQFGQMMWFDRAFPFVIPGIDSLPTGLVARLLPAAKGLISLRATILMKIDEMLNNPGIVDAADQETVFSHFLAPQPSKKNFTIPTRLSLREEVR